MKQLIALFGILLCLLGLIGCNNKSNNNNFQNNDRETLKSYYQNNDGTWQTGDYSYKYRQEIKGRMPNASIDITFVYLSNLETITFQQAWMAAGLSSNTKDYFDIKDAVLVEIKTE